MPRYTACQTAVSLCIWDPEQSSPPSTNTIASNTEDQSTIPGGIATIPEGMSITEYLTDVKSTQSRQHTTGLAAGFVSENLGEEYFWGQDGVNFLSSAPFFTVRAGKDLFTCPQAELTEARIGSLADLGLLKAASTTSDYITGPSNSLEHGTDGDSSLSDISTSRLGFSSSPTPELEKVDKAAGKSTTGIATLIKKYRN